MVGKLPTRSKVLAPVLPFSLPRLCPICESVSKSVRLIDEKILLKNRWKLHFHLLLFPRSSTDKVGSVHCLESLRRNISTSRHPLEFVCQELRFLLLLLLNCHTVFTLANFAKDNNRRRGTLKRSILRCDLVFIVVIYLWRQQRRTLLLVDGDVIRWRRGRRAFWLVSGCWSYNVSTKKLSYWMSNYQ